MWKIGSPSTIIYQLGICITLSGRGRSLPQFISRPQVVLGTTEMRMRLGKIGDGDSAVLLRLLI